MLFSRTHRGFPGRALRMRGQTAARLNQFAHSIRKNNSRFEITCSYDVGDDVITKPTARQDPRVVNTLI